MTLVSKVALNHNTINQSFLPITRRQILDSSELDHTINQSFPKRHILDSSKLKDFADDNFKFDKNGRKLSKWVENTVRKGEIARNFSFSHSVFKRFVSQGSQKVPLCGNGLIPNISAWRAVFKD